MLANRQMQDELMNVIVSLLKSIIDPNLSENSLENVP